MHSLLSHFFESAAQQVSTRSAQSLQTLKSRLMMPNGSELTEAPRHSIKQNLMKFFRAAPSAVAQKSKNLLTKINIQIEPQPQLAQFLQNQEESRKPSEYRHSNNFVQTVNRLPELLAENHVNSVSRLKEAILLQGQLIQQNSDEREQTNIIEHEVQQPEKSIIVKKHEAATNLLNFLKNSYEIVRYKHQSSVEAASNWMASMASPQQEQRAQVKQELRQTAAFPKIQESQIIAVSEMMSEQVSKPNMEVSLVNKNVVPFESTSKNLDLALDTPPVLVMSRQPTFNKQSPNDFCVEANPPKEQFEDVEHFAQYVEQERLEKLRQDIDQLKRQHLKTHTNYDASDEQSASVSSQNEYRPNKLKTDISMGKLQRVFVPMIQVHEANDSEWTQERKLPNTDPKAKKKKTVHKKMVISSLPKSTVVKSNVSRIDDVTLENYAQKILRLKEARQKKLLLEMKLEEINRQITDIKNPEKSLSQIKSPKNSMKEMVQIANDVEAKIKAVSLVSKLKHEREKRQQAANNIFNKVDNDIMESIAELSRLRREQEKKSKQKRKLDVLERMKVHERKKQEASRMQLANNSFVQALKYYDKKNGYSDRKSLAWMRNDDTPQLAARKQVLEKLRDLTYNEKRSVIEEYNRDLLRK